MLKDSRVKVNEPQNDGSTPLWSAAFFLLLIVSLFLSLSFVFSVSFWSFGELIMLAAVKSGDAKKLAELMRQDPGFNVNMDRNGNGSTLLH